MGLRDDGEAQRAKIDSLEERLAAAEARAEQAEREAREARETARDAAAKGAAAREKLAASQADARRNEVIGARREGSAARGAAAGSTAWSAADRTLHFRLCAAFAGLTFGLALLAHLVIGEISSDLFTVEMFGVAGVLIVGFAIIGRMTRAPGWWNGAWTALPSGTATFFAAWLVGSGEALPDWLPEMLRPIVSLVLAVVALVLGTLVAAGWCTDTASSPDGD